jgi:hypothetical protein
MERRGKTNAYNLVKIAGIYSSQLPEDNTNTGL